MGWGSAGNCGKPQRRRNHAAPWTPGYHSQPPNGNSSSANTSTGWATTNGSSGNGNSNGNSGAGWGQSWNSSNPSASAATTTQTPTQQQQSCAGCGVKVPVTKQVRFKSPPAVGKKNVAVQANPARLSPLVTHRHSDIVIELDDKWESEFYDCSEQ